MASYSSNEFRSGLRIIIDGNPCVIVENEFVKPGKGQAFNRVRIKNLKSGKIVDKTTRIQMVIATRTGEPVGGKIENDDDDDAAVGDWIEIESAEILAAA